MSRAACLTTESSRTALYYCARRAEKRREERKRRRVNFAQIDESILSRVAMYNGCCVTVAVRCTDDFIRGNENTYTCLRAEDGRTVSSISSRTRPDIPSETSSLEYPPPSRGGRRPRKRRLSIVTKRKRVVVTGRGVAGCILINRGDIVPTNCHSRVSSSAAALRFIVESWNASLKANSRTHFHAPIPRSRGMRISQFETS